MEYNLSKEDLSEQESEDVNELDECNCSCCIADRKDFDKMIVEETKLEVKNGFKFSEIL